MHISRRHLLKLFATLPLSSFTLIPNIGYALSADKRHALVVGSDTAACYINLNDQSIKRVELGFRPHSFLSHPTHSSRFIAIEKWGQSAAEIDFKNESYLLFKSGDSFQFYGHGIYSEAHKMIFISRVDLTTGLGHLVGYDPETYKSSIDFQITLGGLHESHRLSDNSIMITSSGIRAGDYKNPQIGKRLAASSLIKVDLDHDGKILQELSIEDADQIIGHFAVTRSGQILALSGPAPYAKGIHGTLYYSPDGISPLRALSWEGRTDIALKGEMLSVALNGDHSLAAVTNPAGSMIILVDMKSGKVLKTIHGSNIYSIAYDPILESFLGGSEKLMSIDKEFEQETATPINFPHHLDGAHSLLVSV